MHVLPTHRLHDSLLGYPWKVKRGRGTVNGLGLMPKHHPSHKTLYEGKKTLSATMSSAFVATTA